MVKACGDRLQSVMIRGLSAVDLSDGDVIPGTRDVTRIRHAMRAVSSGMWAGVVTRADDMRGSVLAVRIVAASRVSELVEYLRDTWVAGC